MIMHTKLKVLILLGMLFCGKGFSLEPNEIVIIANSEVKSSLSIAQYYCSKREVPYENIIAWPLGNVSRTTISREDYERRLAEPLRSRLTGRQFDGKVKCLLTTYGVPISVGVRRQLDGKESDLKQLENLLEQEKKKLDTPEPNEPAENKKIIETKIARLQYQINLINGRETNASLDSELSMVLFENYELYRWQPNRLMSGYGYPDINTLMVCRLDGPSEEIVRGLIDKSITTEKTGLHGNAYIDTRGIQNQKDTYGIYDQSLLDMALLTEVRTDLTVTKEQTAELFAPGSCPQTAIYCGWYSLTKYVDAFDFVDGAVGFHIASYEAAALRNPNSSQWCPAMLVDGITATLGAVNEPYLHAFPRPKDFFGQLYEGNCLVEAYYRTNPFNSWQLLLIGDPLYKPFGKKPESGN